MKRTKQASLGLHPLDCSSSSSTDLMNASLADQLHVRLLQLAAAPPGRRVAPFASNGMEELRSIPAKHPNTFLRSFWIVE